MQDNYAGMSETELRHAILGATSLEDCLSVFRELLSRISNAEICFISLLDREHKLLRCVDTILPASMAHFRDTYINFVFSSDSDNSKVLESGQAMHITRESKHLHSASSQLVFEVWKADRIAILPIAPAEGAPCVGTLMLTTVEEKLSAEALERISAWLADSAMLLHLHMNMHVYGEQAASLRNVEAELSSMLKFVAETSNLGNIDAICNRVLEEFVLRFDHDLGTIWLREGEDLRCVATYSGVIRETWIDDWRKHCSNSRLSAVDPQDCGTSYIFITGRPLLFGDIPATRGLKMADKDVALLDITKDLLSLSVHPIRQHGRPIGVLGLFSLRRKHALTPPQMEQIGHWADFLGAVLESARTYDALGARSAELSNRNVELADTLKSLHQAQEALIQSKKLSSLGAIVTAVAHELNTPIGNALTISTAVGDDAAHIQAEMATGLRRATLESFIRNTQHAAQMMHRNLERASNLIENFKEIAVDRKSARRQQFVAAEVLADVLQTFEPKWRAAHVEVDFEVVDKCSCDSYASALGQVVVSLIDNAITHAFEDRTDGKIRVCLRQISPEEVSIEVADNGRGIAPQNLERIFDPFFTTRLGKGSSGLGLFVVYNIITTVLDGKIAVKSEMGRGSCFTLTLPNVAKLEAD